MKILLCRTSGNVECPADGESKSGWDQFLGGAADGFAKSWVNFYDSVTGLFRNPLGAVEDVLNDTVDGLTSDPLGFALNVTLNAFNTARSFANPMQAHNDKVANMNANIIANLIAGNPYGAGHVYGSEVGQKSIEATIAVTAWGAGKAVSKGISAIRGVGTRSINTPNGNAKQSMSRNALQIRSYVSRGGKLYRTGEFGKSNVTNAQYWAPKNPFTPGYASKYGLANSQLDYIIKGTKIPKSPFVTRPAPEFGSNVGGGIEVVTNPNSVWLDYFHMP